MPNTIPTPKMSEILWEEFMEPLGVSAYKLAQAIHVPTSRIQDILHDRRKITADTSLRLAKYFGVSDRYFLDLQNDIDLRELKQRRFGISVPFSPHLFEAHGKFQRTGIELSSALEFFYSAKHAITAPRP